METKNISLEEIAFVNDVIGRFNSGIVITQEEKTTFKNLLELITNQNIVESTQQENLPIENSDGAMSEDPIKNEFPADLDPEKNNTDLLENEMPTEEVL